MRLLTTSVPPLWFAIILWCFFFPSRRRHTRYWRDWSSDVCSSDLEDPPGSSRSDRQGGVSGGGRSASDGVPLLLDLGGLAAQLSEVVQLGAADVTAGDEVGSASCRERVQISGGAGSLKKKNDH